MPERRGENSAGYAGASRLRWGTYAPGGTLRSLSARRRGTRTAMVRHGKGERPGRGYITPKRGHKTRKPSQMRTAPETSSQIPDRIISRRGTRPEP